MSSSSIFWIIILPVLVLLAIGLAVVLWVHDRKRWKKHYTITYQHEAKFDIREVHDGLIICVPPGMTAEEVADRMRPIVEAHGYELDVVVRIPRLGRVGLGRVRHVTYARGTILRS